MKFDQLGKTASPIRSTSAESQKQTATASMDAREILKQQREGPSRGSTIVIRVLNFELSEIKYNRVISNKFSILKLV